MCPTRHAVILEEACWVYLPTIFLVAALGLWFLLHGLGEELGERAQAWVHTISTGSSLNKKIDRNRTKDERK